MIDNKEIVKFLRNPAQSEAGYRYLLQLFSYSFYKFDVIRKNFECDSVFHDFLIKDIFNNKTFQSFLTNSKDEKDIIPYLRRTIRNFLINLHNKILRKGLNISLDEPIYENDKENLIAKIKNERVSHELLFEAESILPYFSSSLNEKNKRILCQYLYSGRYDFITNMSRDAFDKAVERLKDKVKDIVKKHKLSIDSMKIFFDYIYVSEVCEKMRLDNGDTNGK